MIAAAEIRILAALLRAGLSVRAAFAVLPERIVESRRQAFERCARMVRLGASPAGAAQSLEESWGENARAVASLLEVHQLVGGDAAAMLDGLAAAIERREGARRAAAAGVAGIRLSARLVALLPLLFLPLAPAGGFLEGSGVVLLLAGAGLSIAGERWMTKLLPRPDRGAGAVLLLTGVLSAALRGGTSLRTALEACCSIDCPLQEELVRARRRVRLGATWNEALARSTDEALVALGRVLANAEQLGLRVVAGIEAFVQSLVAEEQSRFEEAIRRAPVKMVVPLTTCILPAFALLGLGPFVRSLLG